MVFDNVFGCTSSSCSTLKASLKHYLMVYESVYDDTRRVRTQEPLPPENIALVQEEIMSHRKLRIRFLAAK